MPNARNRNVDYIHLGILSLEMISIQKEKDEVLKSTDNPDKIKTNQNLINLQFN